MRLLEYLATDMEDDLSIFLCTHPVEAPAVVRLESALPCEFELPTAGDVEWLLFSCT